MMVTNCTYLTSLQDLDERALDALKEFPVEGAVTVLKQFLESNLEHVSNKSAYLCGVMKTYRQRKQFNSKYLRLRIFCSLCCCYDSQKSMWPWWPSALAHCMLLGQMAC